ncbi:MAG: heme NO-binding domain-containing protein [Planctomycetia bacterium]|nr:heme NO-binding domain-containing protein [Planctomycetia bacterium]
MKGIVYTEFLEMVESNFSLDLVEQIIDCSDLPSGAIYTTVGTYDYHELLQLVAQMSEATNIAVPDLVRAFGQHLFARFVILFPDFFAEVSSAFEFLQNVDKYIHVEVRKLYPDAELPHFETRLLSRDTLEMIYRSERPFADLAEGLIRGCVAHFGGAMTVDRATVDPTGKKGVRFLLSCPAGVPQCSTYSRR